MIGLKLLSEQVEKEVNRIVDFLTEQMVTNKKVAIGVSGGLDSDVVARLAARIPDLERLKLVFVLQKGLEKKYYTNALKLADDLGSELVTVNLEVFPMLLIKALQMADSSEHFRTDGLLDVSRAKCSLRTPIFSTYQDRGYTILGASNRTEKEIGFFLPFGDGLAHLKPIVHLYKTQVYQIAEYLGTSKEVREQPPSSGMWEGANDLEDIAYWLFNMSPIQEEIDFNEDDERAVEEIRGDLTFEKIDLALLCISRGFDTKVTSDESGLKAEHVVRLSELRKAALILKNREINVGLKNPI